MAETFIDTYAAAKELGISRPTLYRLMEQYGMKRYKLPGNRRTLIRRDDIDRLRQPQERGTEGKAAA